MPSTNSLSSAEMDIRTMDGMIKHTRGEPTIGSLDYENLVRMCMHMRVLIGKMADEIASLKQ